jgi:hypothetical protein
MTALNWEKSNARARMQRSGTETTRAAVSAPRRQAQAERGQTAQPWLTAPIVVDKFWRDRSGRAVIVRLTDYEGHLLIDVRTFHSAEDGTLKPGKGFCCNVRYLPQLAAAVNRALAEARQRGFLPTEAGK